MMLLKGKRVIVVDDDIVNLAVMSAILRRNGAVVYDINPRFNHLDYVNLRQQILRLMPIDLVLTDIMLPNNISGYDIFAKFRAIPELGCVPIVAVTAASAEQELPKAKRTGFNGYISKPVRLSSFGQFVHQVLQGQPVWIADPSTTSLFR
jgi:CheY-like chemotaxis protein